MQVMDLPPNMDEQYPEHDHSEDGQEEVYLPLRGSAEIEIDGKPIPSGSRHDGSRRPGTKRRIRTGSEPCRLLALGGCVDKLYDPPEVTKLGAPDPLLQQQS